MGARKLAITPAVGDSYIAAHGRIFTVMDIGRTGAIDIEYDDGETTVCDANRWRSLAVSRLDNADIGSLEFDEDWVSPDALDDTWQRDTHYVT